MNAQELTPAIALAIKNGIKVTLSLNARNAGYVAPMKELQLFSDMTIAEMTKETFRVLAVHGIGGNEWIIQEYKKRFDL